MNNNTSKRSIISFLILFIFLYIAYRVLGDEIKLFFQNIHQISISGLIFICFLYFLYIFIFAYGYYLQLKINHDQIKLVTAYDTIVLTYFAAIVSSGVGSIPFQVYNLNKNGVDPGSALGSYLSRFVFHRLAILIVSFASLAMARRTMPEFIESNRLYFIYGLAATLIIMLVFILLASSKKVNALALKVINAIPENERFDKHRKNIIENIERISNEGEIYKNNKLTAFRIFLANIFKLFILNIMPYFTFKMLNLEVDFFSCLIASTLMFLLTSTLPNIAGVGPAEFSYMLIFAPIVNTSYATSSMILYRFATYIFPFVLGLISFVKIQRQSIQKT